MASSLVKPAAFPPHSNFNEFPPIRVASDTPLRLNFFGNTRYSQLSVSLNRTKSASRLPVLCAHTSPSPDYLPDAKFYKVEAIIRSRSVPMVSSALLKMGIRGVTVYDVRGFGAQGALRERQAGSEFSEDNFVTKVKMEIVVSKKQVEAVIDKIIEVARTGEIGDGKIFLMPVSDTIRIRTGERGTKVVRMMGGLYDKMNSNNN